jgi:protein-histidine pros-kinase
LIGMGAATFLSYRAAQDNALQEIENEIAMIRANALAVRGYTSSGITPLLADESDILFIPHSVPSFSAQSVFANFQEKGFPEYTYKEAALNPTNHEDLANDWEAGLINQLRADQSLDRVETIREIGDARYFVVAFPFTITKEGCLRCHSNPDIAPAAMLDLYGAENGFGWQLGETIGAQIVSAPMALADKRALDLVIVILAAIAVAFAMVIVLVNIMLSRIVLKPVSVMSDISEQVSMGDFSAPEYVKKGSDEISSLSASFNRMRRSLASAMKLLDE